MRASNMVLYIFTNTKTLKLMRILNGLLAFATVAIFSCNNSSDKTSDQPKTDTLKADTSKKPMADTGAMADMHIRARFVDFTQGDASHYTFKDEAGKTWDFGGCECKDSSECKFAVELPKNKSNETNQGWGANKDLVGKWFHINYVNKDMPQYQDGPVGKVMVITKAVKE